MDLLIRSSEPADYTDLQQLYQSKNVIAGTLQIPFPSAEMWRNRLSDQGAGRHSLVACHDDKIVGHIGLNAWERSPRRRHVGEIGMAVHEEWQGQGIGTALLAAVTDLADNWLNLLRLELTVYVDNEAAIQLYRKFGFEIEGRCRGYAFRNGLFVDAYGMARLVDGGRWCEHEDM